MPLDVMSEESDEDLLMRYVAGDQAAARALTLRLTPRVYAHAWRMLGIAAEAEDVTQEALLRLWRIAPDWRRGEARITTWLYRVVANLSTDRLRRARGVALDSVPEPLDDAESVDQTLQQRSRLDALQQALSRLPERQRQAVILRHIDGLANPEIAEIMEISTEAVESLTARGKRSLSADLAARREELGYTDE